MNSKVSKQWFCDKYAMKALRVHGGGAVLARTSCNVGLRGQYGPVFGIDRLNGLEGTNSPEDMKPSSSASQSERTDEQRGELSLDSSGKCNEGGFRFDLGIALRKYFMSTLVERPPYLPPLTDTATPQTSSFPRCQQKRSCMQIDRDRTVVGFMS